MVNLIHIGNVIIVPSDRKSPYGWTGDEACCDGRLRKLKEFRLGTLSTEWTAWYAPWGGGQRILTDPSEVNWIDLDYRERMEREGKR